MANFIVSFSGIDFGQVCGIFGATIADELGYFDIAAEAEADFDNCTMACNGIDNSQPSAPPRTATT